MDKIQVMQLMCSSRNKTEWNDNCQKVKAACGGYPDFWFKAIIQSGLMNLTLGAGSDKITVSPAT